MSKYDKYKESAFTHEEMQPMIIETDMTDIVERLRGNVPMIWGDEGFMITDDDTVLATFKEAADEIERLREALRDIACDCEDHCDDSPDGHGAITPHCCRNFARAALREKE